MLERQAQINYRLQLRHITSHRVTWQHVQREEDEVQREGVVVRLVLRRRGGIARKNT